MEELIWSLVALKTRGYFGPAAFHLWIWTISAASRTPVSYSSSKPTGGLCLGMAKAYTTVVGIILVVSGLLGFIDNPIVGDSDGALLATDAVHNVVHIATGLLALWIGFGMAGARLANGVTAFGILYLVIFVVCLISDDLFGLFALPVNAADHVLHGALGVVSILVGRSAAGSAKSTPATA
jgi:hypothetical protein